MGRFGTTLEENRAPALEIGSKACEHTGSVLFSTLPMHRAWDTGDQKWATGDQKWSTRGARRHPVGHKHAKRGQKRTPNDHQKDENFAPVRAAGSPEPQPPKNEQKSKKVSRAGQGPKKPRKGSSAFFILFLLHVVAPLGLRNWEPEPGPESDLFKSVGAKRT